MSDSCYWQAQSGEDCYIVMMNLVITLVIGLAMLWYYKTASSYFRDKMLRIYIGIAIWVLCKCFRIQLTLLKMCIAWLFFTQSTGKRIYPFIFKEYLWFWILCLPLLCRVFFSTFLIICTEICMQVDQCHDIIGQDEDTQV